MKSNLRTQCANKGKYGWVKGTVLCEDGTTHDIDFTAPDAYEQAAAILKHGMVVVEATYSTKYGWMGETEILTLTGFTVARVDRKDTCEEVFAEMNVKRAEAFAQAAEYEADPALKLGAMLSRHDWHYMMSDDYSVWQAGEDSMRRIQNQRTLVPSETWVALWDKYCPFEKEAAK